MERIRGSRAGVFVFAAVMAVALVGIFAGNAAASQQLGPVWNGGDVSIIYLNGDALLGSRNPSNMTATRLDLTPLYANLQTLDSSGIADLHLTPADANLGVTQTGSGTDEAGPYTSVNNAGLDANLSGASTFVGDTYTQTYASGNIDMNRAGAHVSDASNAEFGVESSQYYDNTGETYGNRAGLQVYQGLSSEGIDIGFQETYNDGLNTSTNTVGAGLNLAYNGFAGSATLWTENSDGEQAGLEITPTTASLGVQNPDTLQWHGLAVSQDQTVLSGGTTSTSLTLDDNGAAFANASGGPARVTGVADGHSDYDAVNFRQMKSAYGGIASVAALAAIPNPPSGKRFTLGAGYGSFKGSDGLAVGIKAGINNVSFTAGAGYSNDEWTTSLGFGVSF